MLNILMAFVSIIIAFNAKAANIPTIVFDLETHKGHIVNSVGFSEAEFPILSGQKRVVNYIGLTYYAATPEKIWTAKKVEKKGDRITFGKSGRFLRLYDKGKETAYGIHPYRYFEREIERGNNYVSMGCVLVSEENMNIIQNLVEEHGEIRIITTKNAEEYVHNLDQNHFMAIIQSKLFPET